MTGWLPSAYPWIKSFHIIGVITWMAGLLYLPRLYVYHADVSSGSEPARIFEIMERRLLRGIMAPAVFITYLFGAILAATPGVVDWHDGWIWSKLVLVAALTAFHMMLARWRRDFARGTYPHSSRFFRGVNELPAVAMVAIVIFVIVRPF